MPEQTTYIQLTWEDPVTGELHRPLLSSPVAIGREKAQMPTNIGGQAVSQLELESREISRFHALLTITNNRLCVMDKSANGTFLNGRPLGKNSQPITGKDTLRIGPYKMTATLVTDHDTNATEIGFQDHTHTNATGSVAPKNPLGIWLVGVMLLGLMGLGTWALVNTVLQRSRPLVPESPKPSSQRVLPLGLA